MKFFIGVCLFAFAASAYGYRIARDTSSHEEFMQIWTNDKEREYLKSATQYCKNVSGTDDGVEKIYHGLKEFVVCSFKVINVDLLQENFEATLTDDKHINISEVLQDLCEKRKEIYTCFDHFKTYFPLCLNDEDMEAVEILERVFKKVIDFICHNNGEHVFKFIENDGIECMREHGDELKTCYDDVKEKYKKQVDEDFEDIDFKVTKEDCDEYDNQSNCLINMMKATCTKKAVSEVFYDLFVAVKEELPCDKLQNVV